MLALARTAAIGLAGALVFLAADLPLPFLLGPLVASLIAALAGVRQARFRPVEPAARAILGVAIGATITPELIARLPAIAGSIALIPLYTLLLCALGYPYLRRRCGFDHPTAYYAAMPGGLQDMLYFGEEAGGDRRALGLLHATRVAMVVTILPFVVVHVLGYRLSTAPGAPTLGLPPLELATMIALGAGGWLLAKRIRLFGAALLGPMIAAAIATLSGALEHRPPTEAILFAQFALGIGVGASYDGVTLSEAKTVLRAALGHSALLILAGLGFGVLAHEIGASEWLVALLAFAPGGQADMAVLALAAGGDVAFVVAHHLVRLVLVILCAKPVESLAKRSFGRR